MKKTLTTTQSTDLVLKKSKSTLGITKRILAGSKSLTTKSNKDVILSPDVMMINGLMWQKETVEEEMQWEEAMEYAENLSLGGYDDWRLPTIEEFRELVRSFGGINTSMADDDCNNKSDKNISNNHYQKFYEEKGFVSIDSWSSTTYIYDTYYTWYVNFSCGYTSYDYKGNSKYVRCVRVGQ